MVVIEGVTKAAITKTTMLEIVVALEAMVAAGVAATIISNLNRRTNSQVIEAVEIGEEEVTVEKICTTTISMLAINKTSLAR